LNNFFLIFFSDGSKDSKKKRKLNFEDCRVVDDLDVPGSMVQIKVDEDEMQRRIKDFIDQKREELNKNNVRDFIEEGAEDSCARLASNIYRIKDSKGHLKIKRIENDVGPFDCRNNFKSQNAHEIPQEVSSINERIENVENFLKLSNCSVPKDIFHRLKIIEDQIAHLKTISPEYSQFIVRKDSMPKTKVSYNVSDIDQIISSFESKNS
jgi:hypothetical protein